MLNFIGSGGAFNMERGNNSAYLKIGTDLIVFDMGGDVLPKMVRLGVLDGITKLHIFITHMHGDHVGGLANTILYVNSRVLRHQPDKICIYFPNRAIADFLYMQGVEETKHYTLYVNLWDEMFLEDETRHPEYSFEQTEHLEIFGGHVYGIDLKLKNQFHIFYSGDTKLFQPKCLQIDDFTAVYHEVSMNPRGVVHFQYDRLLEVTKEFTPEQKKKIHLMHLDADFDCERALADGYSIVENQTEPLKGN